MDHQKTACTRSQQGLLGDYFYINRRLLSHKPEKPALQPAPQSPPRAPAPRCSLPPPAEPALTPAPVRRKWHKAVFLGRHTWLPCKCNYSDVRWPLGCSDSTGTAPLSAVPTCDWQCVSRLPVGRRGTRTGPIPAPLLDPGRLKALHAKTQMISNVRQCSTSRRAHTHSRPRVHLSSPPHRGRTLRR
jgi:hypothetical protein